MMSLSPLLLSRSPGSSPRLNHPKVIMKYDLTILKRLQVAPNF